MVTAQSEGLVHATSDKRKKDEAEVRVKERLRAAAVTPVTISGGRSGLGSECLCVFRASEWMKPCMMN